MVVVVVVLIHYWLQYNLCLTQGMVYCVPIESDLNIIIIITSSPLSVYMKINEVVMFGEVNERLWKSITYTIINVKIVSLSIFNFLYLSFTLFYYYNLYSLFLSLFLSWIISFFIVFFLLVYRSCLNYGHYRILLLDWKPNWNVSLNCVRKKYFVYRKSTFSETRWTKWQICL